MHHVALRTHQVPELAQFYAAVTGWQVVRRQAHSVWLRAHDGGCVLMIEERAKGEPTIATGSMDVTVFAADRGSAKARLDNMGVRIEARTENTFYFRDPDGRRVGLSDYVF